MATSSTHIHPIFDRMVQRAEKENHLHQRAKVIWFTGLSGSGKSTIALGAERTLLQQGFTTHLLDGDNIRSGINNNLGFSAADRQENIRRIAEVAKLFTDAGIITLCSFVSPTVAIRQIAKEIIGPEDFFEVFVDCPLEICEQRDVKGLYQKARAGIIKDFTGIDAPFEPPANPAITLPTHQINVEEAISRLMDTLIPQITLK